VSPRKLYSFYINDVQAAGLKAIKEAHDMTESEQIRQALNAWLRRWERKGVIANGPKPVSSDSLPDAPTCIVARM
jgi:hypothetical protein